MYSNYYEAAVSHEGQNILTSLARLKTLRACRRSDKLLAEKMTEAEEKSHADMIAMLDAMEKEVKNALEILITEAKDFYEE